MLHRAPADSSNDVEPKTISLPFDSCPTLAPTAARWPPVTTSEDCAPVLPPACRRHQRPTIGAPIRSRRQSSQRIFVFQSDIDPNQSRRRGIRPLTQRRTTTMAANLHEIESANR